MDGNDKKLRFELNKNWTLKILSTENSVSFDHPSYSNLKPVNFHKRKENNRGTGIKNWANGRRRYHTNLIKTNWFMENLSMFNISF